MIYKNRSIQAIGRFFDGFIYPPLTSSSSSSDKVAGNLKKKEKRMIDGLVVGMELVSCTALAGLLAAAFGGWLWWITILRGREVEALKAIAANQWRAGGRRGEFGLYRINKKSGEKEHAGYLKADGTFIDLLSGLSVVSADKLQVEFRQKE